MKLLALDTSSKKLSVAISDDETILAEYEGEEELTHSRDLVPKIEHLLKSTGLKLEELSGFAISIGPGSFTGLRIGVATLKGLGLVTGKPIAAVPTLDVLAHNIPDDLRDICIIIDAKKNKIYTCIYKKDGAALKKKTEYLLVGTEELFKLIYSKDTIFCGDGIGIYKDVISARLPTAQFADEQLWIPHARTVARLGVRKLKENDVVTSDELVPLYLYSRECSIRGIDR